MKRESDTQRYVLASQCQRTLNFNTIDVLSSKTTFFSNCGTNILPNHAVQAIILRPPQIEIITETRSTVTYELSNLITGSGYTTTQGTLRKY